ncbi:hypothetical protein LCGC14_2317980, partial [marine sediment metagenome]
MMALLVIGIVLFLIAIILLSKNIKEIQTDPIIYGMEKHEFNSCTCFADDGQYTTIALSDY